MNDTEVQPLDPEESRRLINFYRDVTEIIKNRILFYFPFYTVFLYFIMNKSDFVQKMDPGVRWLCVATFLTGVVYASLVIRLLNNLQAARMTLSENEETNGKTWISMNDWDRRKFRKRASKITIQARREGTTFVVMMFLLYATAGVLLLHIYFSEFERSFKAWLTSHHLL
ncbi:MAG: hypothetical protein AB1508_12635 [Pseudomonadota bacterium]